MRATHHPAPFVVFALGIPIWVSCQGDDAASESPDVVAQITNVVPTSTTCNQGVGPLLCAHVVPIVTDRPRWKVDGLKSSIEYNGATELPVTLNFANLGGNGIARMQRVSDTRTAPAKEFLYVFLDDIPVPVKTVQGVIVPFGLFDVYLDYNRFEGPTKFVDVEDRLLSLDLVNNTLTTKGIQNPGPNSSWSTPLVTDKDLEYSSRGCVLASDKKTASCDAELKIPLPATATKPPQGSSVQPGMGIFMRHVEINSSLPEQTSAQLEPAKRERTLWETLLFGKPRGFALKVMSWNVNRDDDDEDFQKVTDERIGEFLAENDIVALQEVWQYESALRIQKAANVVRASKGLPEYNLYGPLDFDPSFQQIFLTLSDWVEETQGGLFILSPLQLANEGKLVFSRDDCRGNDCFRAKGVQWVRLNLNPPDTANPNCREGPHACPKPPSGDDYIDVFNIHLQNDDPPLCVDQQAWQDIRDVLLGILEEIPIVEYLVPVIEKVEAVIEDDMHCFDGRTTQQIRESELVAANAFIEEITKEKRDRPSIVTGDTNISGRVITDSSYRTMMRLLGISEAATPDKDLISWTEFADDVDHGDLVRERTDLAANLTTTGLCVGTVIDKDPAGPNSQQCSNTEGLFDGKARTSYILVRPHATVSVAKTLADPRWFLFKGAVPWASPFPSQSGQGPPPERLSDNKPVVAEIVMTPMAYFPKYHPSWKHTATVRVSSVNAQNFDDCVGCDEVDPEAHLWKYPIPAGPSAVKDNPGDCNDKFQVSLPNDKACMTEWFFTQGQTSTINGATIPIQIWEDDDPPEEDDAMSIETESKFLFDAGNNKGSYDFTLRLGNTATSPKATFKTWEIEDTASMIQRCDANLVPKVPGTSLMARVCHRFEIVEKPPQSP